MSDVVVWSAGMVIPITAPSILDGAVAVRDGRIEHVGARGWVIGLFAFKGVGGVGIRRSGGGSVGGSFGG